MKPNIITQIEHQLARHHRRKRTRSILPETECFFRPQTDAISDRAWRHPSDRSRRAFRRMMLNMLAKHGRDEPLEISLYGFVTAIAAWPLVTLLIVLAHAGHG
jgi:hypothetical protein